MNPFDNPSAYRTMTVGSTRLPGKLIALEGADIEYNYDVQKATDKSGASANFKGRKLVEGIKATCELTTASHFVELEAARKALYVSEGQKPPSLDVRNAILNNNGIKALQIKKIGQEKWSSGHWTVDFEFLEYAPPKKTKTGAADASKPANDTGFVEPPVQTKADKMLDDLLNKAKAA